MRNPHFAGALAVVLMIGGGAVLTGCNSQEGAVITSPTGNDNPVESESTVPDSLPLGSRAEVPQGEITVFEVIYPHTDDGGWNPDKGKDYAVADVEMCAGDKKWNLDLTSLDWFLTDPENRSWQSLDSTGYPKEPNFYNNSPILLPGECQRAWVAWEVDKGTELADVKWRDGKGYGLWSIE